MRKHLQQMNLTLVGPKRTQRNFSAFLVGIKISGLSFFFNSLAVILSESAGPLMGQDEIGYLARAAQLTGDPIGFPSKYYPGASLYLAPVLLAIKFGFSMLFSWLIMIAINSVLIGLGVTFICQTPHRKTEEENVDPSTFSLFSLCLGVSPLIFTASYALVTPFLFCLASYSVSRFILSSKRWNLATLITHTLIVGMLGGLTHPTFIFFTLAQLIWGCAHSLITKECTRLIAIGLVAVSSIFGYWCSSLVIGHLEKYEVTAEATKLSASYGGSASQLLLRLLEAPFSPKFYVVAVTTFLAYDMIMEGRLWRRLSHFLSALFSTMRQSYCQWRHPLSDKSERVNYFERLKFWPLDARSLEVSLLGVAVIIFFIVGGIFGTGSRQRGDDFVYLRYTVPYLLPALLLFLRKRWVVDYKKNGWSWVVLSFIGGPFAFSLLADFSTPGPQSDWVSPNNPMYVLPIFRESRVSTTLLLTGVVFLFFWRSRRCARIGAVILIISASFGTFSFRSAQATGHNRDSELLGVLSNIAEEDECLRLEPVLAIEAVDNLGKYGLDVFRQERPYFLVFDGNSIGLRSQVGGECTDYLLSFDMGAEGQLVARELFGGLGLFLGDTGSSHLDPSDFDFADRYRSLQVLERSIDEQCLRAGCFSYVGLPPNGGEKSGEVVFIRPKSPVHGPYANLLPGSYTLTSRVNEVTEDSSNHIKSKVTFSSKGKKHELLPAMSYDEVTRTMTFELSFTIDDPAQMFEVVFESMSEDARYVFGSVELRLAS